METMVQKNEAIVARRNDGRLFKGWVDGVKITARGTLVTIVSLTPDVDEYGQRYNERNYRSIYLEECLNYTTADTLDDL